MDLLFKRTQKRIANRTTFELWAKTDLSDEEQQLIRKYNMQDAVLINVVEPYLIRWAIFTAITMSIFYWLVWILFIVPEFRLYVPWPKSVGVTIILGILTGIIFYHSRRQTIMVKDLMYGRTYKCKSVIELARKEAYLEQICSYFRQVLESAKHWGGQQSFPIEPLPPEEAKRAILSGPML